MQQSHVNNISSVTSDYVDLDDYEVNLDDFSGNAPHSELGPFCHNHNDIHEIHENNQFLVRVCLDFEDKMMESLEFFKFFVSKIEIKYVHFREN